ncbi:hypothetical protein RRG08_060391 [Elysia crispata]|uniref:Uncharacterized protein n=1 Tax=Elysia crispata TaxID=231223 RepID=A0AAE0ZGV3_9GAST|nr:hypothetical protein RRG08_060391 [Elysia crispata]
MIEGKPQQQVTASMIEPWSDQGKLVGSEKKIISALGPVVIVSACSTCCIHPKTLPTPQVITHERSLWQMLQVSRTSSLLPSLLPPVITTSAYEGEEGDVSGPHHPNSTGLEAKRHGKQRYTTLVWCKHYTAG